MQRVIVFGAGVLGKSYVLDLPHNPAPIQVLAYADNKVGETQAENSSDFLFGHPIIHPSEIPSYEYDYILIAIEDFCGGKIPLVVKAEKAIKSIYEQLLALGVPEDKILLQKSLSAYSNNFYHNPRVVFLRNFSKLVYRQKLDGDVAECGVFKGGFAGFINEYFPDRELYLCDTFSGFDERDIETEVVVSNHKITMETHEFLTYGNAFHAWLRCMYKDKVKILKGYVVFVK